MAVIPSKIKRLCIEMLLQYLAQADRGILQRNEREKIMENQKISVVVNGGQVNVASDNAIINATQNNGVSVNELDDIVKGIMSDLPGLKTENIDAIVDIVEMAKEELTKQEPKVSRLKNCLSLIAPVFAIANGIPTLAENLQKLQGIIMQYIK